VTYERQRVGAGVPRVCSGTVGVRFVSCRPTSNQRILASRLALVWEQNSAKRAQTGAADLIDSDGLSARVGADQLGHAKISMTQDKYMSRGRVHAEVAALLDRTRNDE
jgi:hypothetical protein